MKQGDNEVSVRILKKYIAICEGLGIEATLEGLNKIRNIL